MKVTVLVGAGGAAREDMTDMTEYCILTSLDISSSLYSQVDYIVVRMVEDPSVVFSMDQGNDLIIEDQDNSQIRFFGGVIQNITITSNGINQLWNIRAVDWTYILSKTTIQKTYEAAPQTDQTVIRAAITGTTKGEAALTEFDVNNVTEGRNINGMQFNGSTLQNVLDEISSITGFIWFVDPFKRIHYRDRTICSAQIAFSSNPSIPISYPVEGLQITKKLAALNHIEVEGGGGLSDDTTEIYAGDGSTTVFTTGPAQQANRQIITHSPVDYDTPRVYKNTGSNASPTWTEQTVRGEGVTTVTSDVEWRTGLNVITFDSAPPNFANSWRITGRYRIRTKTIASDPNAIARHGRLYKTKVRATEATVPEHAHELAMALLRENTDRVLIRFTTNYERPEPGQMASMTHPGFNLNLEPFLIQNVDTSIIGGEVSTHTVSGEIINNRLYA